MRGWARIWAQGPCADRHPRVYVPVVDSDDAEGARNEQPVQRRQGSDRGRVPGHHRGGGGDCAGDHGDGYRQHDLRRHHRADRQRHRRLTRLYSHSDAGQAFPIYNTVVGGLLLLAFAYLAVGQAAANRNSAQTAADAAALAAALDTRDELTDEWVENVLDPTKWQDIFDGGGVAFGGCARATQLAAQNDASVQCGAHPEWALPGYEVEATTNQSVGDSIVPGTEGEHS